MKNGYIKKAEEYYKIALRDIKRSKKRKDEKLAVNGCGKAYLALDLATKGLFQKKGVAPARMPKSFRGLRYFLQRYGTRAIRKDFDHVRDVLHINGYYEQIVEYETIMEAMEDLGDYIKTVESL